MFVDLEVSYQIIIKTPLYDLNFIEMKFRTDTTFFGSWNNFKITLGIVIIKKGI